MVDTMLNLSCGLDVLLVFVDLNLRGADAMLSQVGRKQWRSTLIDFR